MLGKYPGRFRAGYVVNANFLFKTIIACARALWKAKVVDRIRVTHKADLHDLLAPENLWSEYGGTWVPDPRQEVLEPALKRYAPKGPVNAWKSD